MIYLHTGLPGAGKTLFTLAHVKPLAEKEGRQVYYFNIPQVQIPEWIEIDEEQFKKWYELPPNSIIIADEAQRIFRPRAASSKVPEHVEKLETHRHLGVDLYLITQHPGLLDLNVRKLVGTHRHVVRSFGSNHAVVHAWGQVKDNCDKSRSDSVKTQFRYPKEVFSWYKSAEVHTHKRSIPFRVLMLPVLVLLIGFMAYSAYQGLTVDSVENAKMAIAKAQGVPVESLDSAGQGTSGAPGAPGAARRPITAEQYVEQLRPRVDGLPWSAPIYDAVTVPVQAPRPMGCFDSKKHGCYCVDQQSNRLAVDADFCRNYISRGMFVSWVPESAPPPLKGG